MSNYNINKVREDFPILSREIYGKSLVYLDNAYMGNLWSISIMLRQPKSLCVC